MNINDRGVPKGDFNFAKKRMNINDRGVPKGDFNFAKKRAERRAKTRYIFSCPNLIFTAIVLLRVQTFFKLLTFFV